MMKADMPVLDGWMVELLDSYALHTLEIQTIKPSNNSTIKPIW
jgi:hypothetical protein